MKNFFSTLRQSDYELRFNHWSFRLSQICKTSILEWLNWPKHQICHIVKCHITIFVWVRSYLEIIQGFTKSDSWKNTWFLPKINHNYWPWNESKIHKYVVGKIETHAWFCCAPLLFPFLLRNYVLNVG